MSEENVEGFWRAVERFNRAMESEDPADWRRYLEQFVDPEIEWVNAPGAIEPGTKRGHAGMNAVWENFRSAFERLRVEPQRVIALGDRVVSLGIFRGRGRGSGLDVDVPYGAVLTFRDGKVGRWENFDEPSEALEAAGLSE
jgi:ketosteroid isomerase-like protein